MEQVETHIQNNSGTHINLLNINKAKENKDLIYEEILKILREVFSKKEFPFIRK